MRCTLCVGRVDRLRFVASTPQIAVLAETWEQRKEGKKREEKGAVLHQGRRGSRLTPDPCYFVGKEKCEERREATT